jgi:endonuclease/exonuclease/phosphatase family metal-dependent hydrolase
MANTIYFLLAYVYLCVFMANSNTVMGRDMLVTTCTFNSKPLTLVNTHLESGGEAAQQRVIQLNTALETLTTAQSGTATTKKAVILAGDLNLREKETKEVTRLKAVHDAWEITLGASKVCSACTHAATAYLTRLQRISSA